MVARINAPISTGRLKRWFAGKNDAERIAQHDEGED